MTRTFEVFKHPTDSQAVKRGFSWPGFFFTCIWALVKRLWLVGGVVLVISLVVSLVSSQTFRSSPLLVVCASLVVRLVVGRKGNRWRSDALQADGYAYIGAIEARDAAAALARVAQLGGVIPAESHHLHTERCHRFTRAVHPLAGLWHAGARHRGMPDPGRGGEADCSLADLAGQMAGTHVAECRVAGRFRRERICSVAMARHPAAHGRADRSPQRGAGSAWFGEGKKFRRRNSRRYRTALPGANAKEPSEQQGRRG